MKNIIVALLLFLPLKTLAGGPSCSPSASNDACSGITLIIDDPCINGTTCDATLLGGESTGCGSASTNQTVWYKFTASTTDDCVSIERTGGGGCFLGSTVWDACLPGSELSCEDAASGPNTQTHCDMGLTPGNTYYVQIQYGSGGPCGTHSEFCIQVNTMCTTCSDECGNLCVLTSSEDPAIVCTPTYDYTITPPASSTSEYTQCYTFTATDADVSFQTGLTFLSCGTVQYLDWELYNNSCGLFDSGDLSDWTSTGLTVGNTYTHCFTFLPCEGGVFTELRPRAVMTPILPIELVNFSCGETQQGLGIGWITASESNSYIFILEHSPDGVDFEIIREIPAAGNSSKLLPYNVLHSEPLEGINYYKLTQIDFDGKRKTFPITACIYDPDYLYSSKEEVYTWSGEKVNRIDTPGIYVVQTTIGNKITYKKVVKW